MGLTGRKAAVRRRVESLGPAPQGMGRWMDVGLLVLLLLVGFTQQAFGEDLRYKTYVRCYMNPFYR